MSFFKLCILYDIYKMHAVYENSKHKTCTNTIFLKFPIYISRIILERQFWFFVILNWYLRKIVGRFCDHILQNEELPGLNGFPLQNSYQLQAAHLVRTVSVPILQARTSQHLCLLMSLQHKCD